MLRSKLLASCFVSAALFLVPAISSGQTLSIVSGNGQLVCPVCPSLATQQFVPLVVSVTNSSGALSANTVITWSAVTSGGSPVVTTYTTSASGLASYTYSPILPPPGSSFTQTIITAGAGTSTVQFTETTVVPSELTGFAPVQINLISPVAGQALTGTAGQTASTPVQVQVYVTQEGLVEGLAGVALQIVPGTSGATASCMTQTGQQPGTVLTDSSGTATCMLVFGGTIGTGTYTVSVGVGYANFIPGALTITAGPPAVIKIISGNNQAINPGALSPLALTAEVTDLGGNPSQGATVSWSVSQGSATLSNTVTTSTSTGQVSTNVTAGSSGPIQVTVKLSNSTAQVTFTLAVNTIVTQLQVVSGNNQSVAINTVFADPLIVQVNDQTTPVPGVVVTFAVSSGSALLSASSATSNAQGLAQITVTAGATAGPILITATVGDFSQPFNLTAVPPGPVISSFTNAAGFQVGSISPCSLATIIGTGLATGIQGAVTSFLEPQTLVAGVSVQFATVPAPILSVVNENNQESVTVQVPCEATPGTVSVVVTVGGGSTTVPVTVLPISPGIFQTTMSDGELRAVLVRPDGSYVSLQNPARIGEVIRMYATGLGQTSPPIVTGQTVPLVTDASGNLTPEAMPVNAPVVIGVDNAGVQVVSAQYAYGMVGVYEVQFVLQSADTGDNIPFAILMFQNGQAVFGNPSAIPTQ
jgi:uncharacterized protein (TIGR03437 family)